MPNSALQIRIDDETKEKFRLISEEFSSQGECVQGLINAYELQKAKQVLPGMETNISDFQAMAEELVKAYINVLDLNANSEKRIRLEFQDKLDNLNLLVVELRERLKTSEEFRKEAEERVSQAEKELSNSVAKHSETIQNLEKELEQVKEQSMQYASSLQDKQTIIDSLSLKIAQADETSRRACEAITTAEQAKSLQREAEERAEALQAELARVKAEAENEKKNASERAEIKLERAVIEVEKKANAELKKIIDETTEKQKELLDKLNAEQKSVAELTKEIAELRTNMKNQKAKKKDD